MSPAPIIALAPNDWHGPWRNRQHLLSRLARRNWPVTYSQGLFASWEVPSQARLGTPIRGRVDNLAEGLRIYRQGLLPFRYSRLPRIDRHAVRAHARALLAASGQRRRADLVVAFHPAYRPYVEYLEPRRVVYYMYDGIDEEFRKSPELALDWHALLERADLLVATSEQIALTMPFPARDRARVLPNGADVGLIQSLENEPCPDCIASIPRPRIGYSGVVNAKLDYALLHDIARRHPQWHWVFIGPEVNFAGHGGTGWAHQATMRERCRELPNAHFLGPLPHPQFLTALHHMDVNVLCNRTDSGWWQLAYPLKFHEYLASGRPVVSAPVPSLSAFGDVAAFADTVDRWERALREALEGGGIGTYASRRAVAAHNDWDRRADQLESWLQEIMQCDASGIGVREAL